jgi:hypothetical protein
MRLGLDMTLKYRGGATPVFDPATMNLTIWSRAAYAGAPWGGVASAGTSGSRSLATGAGTPTAGATLNGLASADFDGTNQRFVNATAISTLLTASAWFAWALIYIDVADSASANSFSNDCIVGDSGSFWGMFIHATGPKVQVYQYDGAVKNLEMAITTGAWNLVMARYDGTNIRGQINSTLAPTPTAAGNITTLTGTLAVGGRAAFVDGRMADVGISPEAHSDARFTDIKAYVNSRYALSL